MSDGQNITELCLSDQSASNDKGNGSKMEYRLHPSQIVSILYNDGETGINYLSERGCDFNVGELKTGPQETIPFSVWSPCKFFRGWHGIWGKMTKKKHWNAALAALK